MSKNKSSFDYFMQGLLLAGMLTWHDYCVEKENMQKRKEEWERDCRIKIADSASEMVDAIVNHLTGLQLNGYPPVIVEGINNLPFYAFNLVDKRNGFSVNSAQKEAKRLFKDHLFKDKEPDINVVNITESSCGEFWIELFKSMKSEKADRELIKKIVDPFSTIIAVYSLLGEINESDYEDNITTFNNALRAQYLKSKDIKDEGIDTYGVNKLKDFYKEFNGKLRYYYDASGVAAEDAPDFCEMLPLYYSGLIYNMLKRNSGLSEMTKFDIYEYLYNLCCSEYEFGAKTSYELMKDADENDKENLFIVLSSLKCVDKGFLGLLCILGSKCESAGIKFDGLNEFVNLSLAIDSEIEEKYPQYSLNGIGREYIVEYIRRYSEFINDDDFGKDLDIEEENASDNSFSIEETKDDNGVLTDEENLIVNYNLDGSKGEDVISTFHDDNKDKRKIVYKQYSRPYKMKLKIPIILFIIGVLNVVSGNFDSNVSDKEALESLHSGKGNPHFTGPISIFLGLIAAIVGLVWIINEIIKYAESKPPKEEKHDKKIGNKEIKTGLIVFIIIFTFSALIHLKGQDNSPDPEKAISEYLDTYEEKYDYVIGEVHSEDDTYKELVNISLWYYERYNYIKEWNKGASDFFDIKNTNYLDCTKKVNEETQRRYDEINDILEEYVSQLIDKSDANFKDRKEEIVKQMNEGAYCLANAKISIDGKNYVDGFEYAIQYGDYPLNNIVVETMNNLYPVEMRSGCNAFIDDTDIFLLDEQVKRLGYVKLYYRGIGIIDEHLNSRIDELGKELRKQSNSNNTSSNSGNSSNNNSGSSGRKTESTTAVDPMDHDMDTYYEDFKDEFEDEDDAWDDFEDNEEYWDEY